MGGLVAKPPTAEQMCDFNMRACYTLPRAAQDTVVRDESGPERERLCTKLNLDSFSKQIFANLHDTYAMSAAMAKVQFFYKDRKGIGLTLVDPASGYIQLDDALYNVFNFLKQLLGYGLTMKTGILFINLAPVGEDGIPGKLAHETCLIVKQEWPKPGDRHMYLYFFDPDAQPPPAAGEAIIGEEVINRIKSKILEEIGTVGGILFGYNKIGPQNLFSEKDVNCITWSVIFAHICALNPERDPEQINQFLIESVRMGRSAEIMARYQSFLLDVSPLPGRPGSLSVEHGARQRGDSLSWRAATAARGRRRSLQPKRRSGKR